MDELHFQNTIDRYTKVLEELCRRIEDLEKVQLKIYDIVNSNFELYTTIHGTIKSLDKGLELVIDIFKEELKKEKIKINGRIRKNTIRKKVSKT
ncbi:MAG: hypothetical protein AABY22_13315 [Nanoarchaeota archaeon]